MNPPMGFVVASSIMIRRLLLVGMVVCAGIASLLAATTNVSLRMVFPLR